MSHNDSDKDKKNSFISKGNLSFHCDKTKNLATYWINTTQLFIFVSLIISWLKKTISIMKDFLKFTLATVTGIILSSIVLFIVSMVTLFGIMSASDTETIVKKNSVMMLDLNGTLVERTQENPLDILSQLFSDDSNIYGLDDILSSIKKAKENENIKGIYLQASSLGTSYASLQEIRNALLDFKESGKFIIAYGDSYTQGLYYLSS